MTKVRRILFCMTLVLLLSLLSLAAAEDGLLSGVSFTELEEEGFLVPLPEGAEWNGGANRGRMGLFGEINRQDASGAVCTLQYYYRTLSEFANDSETALRYYQQLNFAGEENVRVEQVDIGGHVAQLVTFSYHNGENEFGAYAGIILYAREKQLLQLRVYSEWAGQSEDRVPEVTMDDLKELVGRIGFDPEKASICFADVEFEIQAQDGATAVVPGTTLQLNAVFGDPGIVNNATGNNAVFWRVVDVSTGEDSVVASIRSNGLLSVLPDVRPPVRLEVQAVSETFGTTATCEIIVVEPAEKITVDKAKVSFYAGENTAVDLAAVLSPESIYTTGVSWSVSRPATVLLEDHGDGTATVRPGQAGKATVEAREPGGKKAKVEVTVMQPVEEVKLSVRGKPKPGASVMIDATVLPKTAAHKGVTWSVDCDESIATITAHGKLKIKKAALVGTIIRVTCEATGAPAPVYGTLDVTIIEK